ncbi:MULTISPECIES: hypothetical protein [unclassified Mesorhizobium]|uniref:hypothetical protein n=1 Tax=unclassified Mesorhizobium TaxID=325217 RepID=UPI001129A2D7|nr:MULTISPECIES: hypothetical protein [unclassified Mesorhizobium]TPL00609.1 hypothetical protein FJ567_13710 [Mesorhizobium sp. B2-4-16]TPL63650.1 hypothetical protein FJ956_23140 [Mesorhizobium sp. B2-4-3]
MFLDVLRFLGGIASAAAVIAFAGAIAGNLLRSLSRRVTSRRLGWLLGDLSAAEAFGIGLLLMTFVVAAMHGWIGSSAIGPAWFRYATGAGVAFCVFLMATRSKQRKKGQGQDEREPITPAADTVPMPKGRGAASM